MVPVMVRFAANIRGKHERAPVPDAKQVSPGVAQSPSEQQALAQMRWAGAEASLNAEAVTQELPVAQSLSAVQPSPFLRRSTQVLLIGSQNWPSLHTGQLGVTFVQRPSMQRSPTAQVTFEFGTSQPRMTQPLPWQI